MILFTEKASSRLRYIADFFSKEILAEDIIITGDPETFRQSALPRINYSDYPLTEKEIWIKPAGLLAETGICAPSISCFEWNGYKAFFKTEGDFPFDIFSSAFYLLSRYEEYLPHEKDMYGRYAHENSLAYKEEFLKFPLVNIWLQDFKKFLQSKYSSGITHHSSFRFLPTYDIDIAYSYRGKGFFRNTAGFVKSFFRGDFAAIRERSRVLSGKEKDPYDSFDWMDELHRGNNLQPVYFFLIPEIQGTYDKNILPSEPVMKKLVTDTAEKYTTAIHPSWKSGDEECLLSEETGRLRELTGKTVDTARFHYVRFHLPHSYRRLIHEGIKKDHSMGYGSINGFRASVASSFFWYDLEKEEQTELEIFPFCFMEANSYYEQKYSVKETKEEIMQYLSVVRSVNGLLITLWHNHFFGTCKEFAGLREVYADFIKEAVIT